MPAQQVERDSEVPDDLSTPGVLNIDEARRLLDVSSAAAEDHDPEASVAFEDQTAVGSHDQYPEAPGFWTTPLIEDPEDDVGASGAVFDIFTAQGGFMVRKLTSAKANIRYYCAFCDDEITNPARQGWVCECSGDVNSRPVVNPSPELRHCQCSACIYNADVRVGRPPEKCSKPECGREYKRCQRAALRERQDEEDRRVAVEAIRNYPTAGNRSIADFLGIRPKRVSEAGDLIPA